MVFGYILGSNIIHNSVCVACVGAAVRDYAVWGFFALSLSTEMTLYQLIHYGLCCNLCDLMFTLFAHLFEDTSVTPMKIIT